MQLPLFSGRAPRPGASRARGPVSHCTSGRPLNPPLARAYKPGNIFETVEDKEKVRLLVTAYIKSRTRDTLAFDCRQNV